MSLITFDQVWASDFAPLMRAAQSRKVAQRSEAFLDVPLTVAGEELRQMTVTDLLMLDGFGSPFVMATPGGGVEADEIEFFLWQLHVTNHHTGGLFNAYRRGKMLGRVRKLDYGKITEEIWTYCERMFAELGEASEDAAESGKSEGLKPQPRSYFLAPLLVSVAAEIGHCDPMSGALLSHTPLPRLLQYRAAFSTQKTSDDGFKKLRIQCADRVNQINWTIRSQSRTGAQPTESTEQARNQDSDPTPPSEIPPAPVYPGYSLTSSSRSGATSVPSVTKD